MYHYSLKYIKYLRRRALRLPFRLPEGFEAAPLRALQRAYNGIGPDRWSCRVRRLTTLLLRPFEIAALVHDYEYATAPRTYRAFTRANVRFAANAILEAYHRHPVRLPLNRNQMQEARRCIMMAGCGLLLAVVCQLFGWQGYKKTKMEG